MVLETSPPQLSPFPFEIYRPKPLISAQDIRKSIWPGNDPDRVMAGLEEGLHDQRGRINATGVLNEKSELLAHLLRRSCSPAQESCNLAQELLHCWLSSFPQDFDESTLLKQTMDRNLMHRTLTASTIYRLLQDVQQRRTIELPVMSPNDPEHSSHKKTQSPELDIAALELQAQLLDSIIPLETCVLQNSRMIETISYKSFCHACRWEEIRNRTIFSPLFNVHPTSLAVSFAILESNILKQLNLSVLTDSATEIRFPLSTGSRQRHSLLISNKTLNQAERYLVHFHGMTKWFECRALEVDQLKQKKRMIEHLVSIAQGSLAIRNFATYFQIVTALKSVDPAHGANISYFGQAGAESERENNVVLQNCMANLEPCIPTLGEY